MAHNSTGISPLSFGSPELFILLLVSIFSVQGLGKSNRLMLASQILFASGQGYFDNI